MALTFEPRAPQRIEFGDGNFIDVRPLNIFEMVDLFKDVAARLGATFDLHSQADFAAMRDDEVLIRKFCWALFSAAPDILSRAIALAADAQDRIDDIKLLPLDVSIATAELICRTSFPDPSMFARLLQHVGNAASRSSAIHGIRH